MRKDKEILEEIVKIQEVFSMKDTRVGELMGITRAYYSHKKNNRNGNIFSQKDLENFRSGLKEELKKLKLLL